MKKHVKNLQEVVSKNQTQTLVVREKPLKWSNLGENIKVVKIILKLYAVRSGNNGEHFG